LRELLVSANEHVPYYRDLFAQRCFNPTHVESLDVLRMLPFLTKSDIRTNTERLKARNAQGLARFNTGGSSGEPLIFFIGNKRISHDVAAKWRATRWWEVDIGDPEIVVWGSPIELVTQDRIRQWRDKLLRTKLLPAFEMSPQKLDDFVAEIRAMRPKMLFGYPSALTHIAAHAETKGIRMDDLGICVAFVTSEKLYDHQRKKSGRFLAAALPTVTVDVIRASSHMNVRVAACILLPRISSSKSWMKPEIQCRQGKLARLWLRTSRRATFHLFVIAPAISACWTTNPAPADEDCRYLKKFRGVPRTSSLRKTAR
jgi:hypothetical protein